MQPPIDAVISFATIATIAALVIALAAAGGAVYGALQIGKVFRGQNFLSLMEALQDPHQRDCRGTLKEHLRQTGRGPAWTHGKLSPAAEAANDVGQLFDQVGILVKEKMLGRKAMLNNWSVTIVEMFVVCHPVIAARRTQSRNERLWHSFEWLARMAMDHSQRAAVLGRVRADRELIPNDLAKLYKQLPRSP